MGPKTKSEKPQAFILPPQLIGQADINRLLRELETLDETLIRDDEKSANAVSKVTSLLNQTAKSNGYNLSEEYHRQHISEQLMKIRDHAPVLHISYAAEPSPKVTETVLGWLRENVHRYVLLQVGLQPSIAAGCVLRTANKVFDMSLGASLDKQKSYLLQLITKAVDGVPLKNETRGAAK